MPELNWIGKRYVVNHAEEVPFRLLRRVPKTSMGEQDTGNMIVHGDNLEALKALMPYYRNRVKLVFIDPPYNTGNERWVYNDRVNAPKILKWLNKVVGGEGEDLSRHDKWLCMMYPRLELLHELLAEDGMIFVSIDDNEMHHLRLLLDEIFGARNFLMCATWQKRVSPDSDEAFATNTHDYIVAFAKDKRIARFNKLARTEAADARYSNPDEDPRGPWTSSDLTRREYREHDYYPIELPSGRTVKPAPGRSWGVPKDSFAKLRADNRIWFGPRGDAMPRRKRFLSEVSEGMVPTTWWSRDTYGDNQSGKQALRALFPETNDIFATPKPPQLIGRIIELATDSQAEDIVLDSFAGSGTTAHAVLNKNAEDGGNRKFVLVEMEDFANILTAERVRRVIRGKEGQLAFGPEAGFDYYELDKELFTTLGERINPSVTKEMLGRFAYFLESGSALDNKAASTFGANGTAFVGSGYDADLYMFYEPNGTTVFGEKELAALPPSAVGKPIIVYADRCAVDAADLEAKRVLFRKIPRDLQDLVTRYKRRSRA